MLTLRLAWRSFLRHRRRSAITTLALALGLTMMLVVVGAVEGRGMSSSRGGAIARSATSTT